MSEQSHKFKFYMKKKKNGEVTVRFTISNSIAQTLIDALREVPVEIRDFKTDKQELHTVIEFVTPDEAWAIKLHQSALRILRDNSGLGKIFLN